MRHRLILVIAVSALLIAACGDDDDSGTGGGNGGGSSSSDFGTGLKLGTKAVSTAKVGSTVEPWYVWNPDECAFEKTDDHPADYKAETRDMPDGAPQLGYMHYGNSDPFGVAVSKSIEAEAKDAGMDVNVYNLKFPSRTEPQAVANASLVDRKAHV